MKQAIRELLAVEREARDAVENAEKEADRIRRDARAQADALLDKARADAVREADAHRAKAVADARAEKDRLIEDARTQIRSAVAVPDDRRRRAMELIVRALLGADDAQMGSRPNGVRA